MSNISPTYSTTGNPLKSHPHKHISFFSHGATLELWELCPFLEFFTCPLSPIYQGVEGRRGREDLWSWTMPPESCLCLRHASLGIFSNIQSTWELGDCRVNLATSLFSSDGSECWQVVKVGTAAEKWYLQTWGQVQRELKYRHGFSCLCVPRERPREGAVSQTGECFSLTLYFRQWHFSWLF